MLSFDVHILIASYITRICGGSLYFSCVGDVSHAVQCRNHEKSWISPRANQNISGVHDWPAIPEALDELVEGDADAE